jgi:hypothetical protein
MGLSLRVAPHALPLHRLATVVRLEKVPVNHAEATARSDAPGLEKIAGFGHCVHRRERTERVSRPQVLIEDGTRSAWVDERMAPLILECLRHGIDTVGSCETSEFFGKHEVVGLACIFFASDADAARFEILGGAMVRPAALELYFDCSLAGGCSVGFIRDINGAVRSLADAPCSPPTNRSDGRFASYSTRGDEL